MTDDDQRSWRDDLQFAKDYKQNDLFRPHQAWRLNACVGRNGGPYDFEHYALGYFRAGQRLAISLVHDQGSIDLIVYPLVFTFRQAVELAIKQLAEILPKIWGEPSQFALTHRLLDNWEFVKGYLERHAAFSPVETVPQVDKIIRDFVEIDPNGEAFRYPSARSGALLLQDTAHINVVVFGKAMQFLEEVFDMWWYNARRLKDEL